MKKFIRLVATVSFLILVIASCNNTGQQKQVVVNQNKMDLKRGQVKPKKVKGGKYPLTKPNLKKPLNEEEKPFKVPSGPKRGKLQPNNKEFKIKEQKPGNNNGSSQSPLDFKNYKEIKEASPIAHQLNPEPSIAENGNTIMMTGNFWVSLSKDGGASFNTISPTTVFPENYGGFCCDQVLQYIPKYDLFVWLLQYSGDATGTNAIRIAVATTEEVRSNNGTSWTYWDFTNTSLSSSGALDYNDMSFGDNYLYWSSSIGGGANRYVIRVPLSEMQSKGTINFQYTGSTSAFWSHVSQNGTNGVYWAGHKDNSTMTVYSMMDADGSYSWRDISIGSWPNDVISSIAANGTDWLQDASWKTYVRAAAVFRNNLYFAWNASKGNGFPQPHIQIVQINTNDFSLVNQMQIWNPDFAFAYPYFETNSNAELGMIAAFGGGPYNSSSGVGVWGDFVLYYPGLSAISQNNYAHYHTAHRLNANGAQWAGAGYMAKSDGSILPYYVSFGR